MDRVGLSLDTMITDDNDFGDSPRGMVLARLDLDGQPLLQFPNCMTEDLVGTHPPPQNSYVHPDSQHSMVQDSSESVPRRRERNTGQDAAANGTHANRLQSREGAVNVRCVTPAGSADGQLRVSFPERNVWPSDATTVMLRNLPNRYTAEELIAEMLAAGFQGAFDFFYLPIDFTTKRNKGYCFINFHSQPVAGYFVQKFHQQRLTRYATRKILEVSPALTQGLEANVAQYARKDAQRVHNPWFRPMILSLDDTQSIMDRLSA